MAPQSDETVISKTITLPVKATKGDDLWAKVKSKATESALYAASSIVSSGQNHHTSPSSTDESNLSLAATVGEVVYPLIELDCASNVLIASKKAVDVWNWQPSPDSTATTHQKIDKHERTLFLQAHWKYDGEGVIELIKCMRFIHAKQFYQFLVVINLGNGQYSAIVVKLNRNVDETSTLELPESFPGPYQFSLLDNYFILISSNGALRAYNVAGSCEAHDFEATCKLVNGSACLATQGDCVVYYASTTDRVHQDVLLGKYPVSPLNLPKPGPLLKRVLKNLSSTAMDGIFKIAEISHSKVKKIMASGSDEELAEEVASQQKGSSSGLRDTITKILNAINGTSNKQFLVYYSLTLKKVLFVFSPPGGCSKVSVSPYDLVLSTATLRGDDIFLWDFSKFDSYVSLLRKFRRGSTPGIVEKFIWYPQNEFLGVLSRLSGTLHWFTNDPYDDSDVSRNWIMSALKLRDVKFSATNFDSPTILAIDRHGNLRFIDTKGTCNTFYSLPDSTVSKLPAYLKKTSPSPSPPPPAPTTANHSKMSTQSVKVASSTQASATTACKTAVQPAQVASKTEQYSLSSLKLTYTMPYEFFYKNRKVEFYDKQDSGSDLSQWFAEKDHEKNLVKIEFGKANGEAIFHDSKESLDMLLKEQAA